MKEQTIFQLLHTIEQVTYKTLVDWRKQSKTDLGISHILVLHELESNGESRPSHLAETLHFTPASLTHLSTKLAEQRLIERRQDEADRRISYWSITDEGRRILQRAQRDGQPVRKKLFMHLTTEEQQALLAIYEKLYRVIQN